MNQHPKFYPSEWPGNPDLLEDIRYARSIQRYIPRIRFLRQLVRTKPFVRTVYPPDYAR